MIAYHILCHGNFAQVARLIEALYTPDDVFLIDIDDGKYCDSTEIDGFTSKFARETNIHIMRDANIGWGASGTLRKTIRGAFELLRLDTRWQYYIVLSGQDLPLKNIATIKAELAVGAAREANYLRYGATEVLVPNELPVISQSKRIELWGDRGHTKVYAKPGAINPQTNHGARWLVDVTEVGEQGEVYIGRCDELLLKRRRTFFERYPYFEGPNWFNLHRSLLEFMIDDPFAYELYDVLRGTFIPDESFFQTYIMNTRFRDTVDWNYGRLILRPGPKPRVKVFTEEDWPQISECPELFGRKFDTRESPEIVDRVLEHIRAAA